MDFADKFSIDFLKVAEKIGITDRKSQKRFSLKFILS